jgi:hypothetical protein
MQDRALTVELSINQVALERTDLRSIRVRKITEAWYKLQYAQACEINRAVVSNN